MKPSDIYILIGLFALVLIVLPFGLAFYPFLILRSQLVHLARGTRRGNPTGLYLSGFWRGFLWCLLMICCFMVPCLGVTFYLLGGLGGYVGWLIVWFQGRANRIKLKAKNVALAPLQFSMTDLFSAVFLYAICMTLILTLVSDTRKKHDGETLFWSGYLMFAMGLGYYIALDALRRHAEKVEGRARTVHILVVMLTSAFFLPVAWLTWRSWRYALCEVLLFPYYAPNGPPSNAQWQPTDQVPPQIPPSMTPHSPLPPATPDQPSPDARA